MNWIITQLKRLDAWLSAKTNNGCDIGLHDYENVEVYVCTRRYVAGRRAVEHRICLNCGKQIDEVTEAKRLDREEWAKVDQRQALARSMAQKAKP